MERVLPVVSSHGIAIVIILAGVVQFSATIFHVVERLHRRILRQNIMFAQLYDREKVHIDQLQALNDAGIGITLELSLEAVLNRAIELPDVRISWSHHDVLALRCGPQFYLKIHFPSLLAAVSTVIYVRGVRIYKCPEKQSVVYFQKQYFSSGLQEVCRKSYKG